MARILVTGGAGYIGSVCAQICLERGHEVVVLDDLSTGFRDAVPAGARFFQTDIACADQVAPILAAHPVDAVFHFAAKALIPESVINPGVFFDRNLAGGIRFLEILRRAGVGRLIFSSTAAVYGNPLAVPITEEHPTAPVNAYGESKLALERVLEWYARAYGWSVVIFRYFSAAGALPGLGERHAPETHLLPLVLEAAAGRRREFCVYGDDYPTPDGTCLRDFVHVRDLVEAHLLALTRVTQPGVTTLNVGAGRMYSIREVVEATRAVTGRDFPVVVGPRRSGDPAQLCASPRRLMATLDWAPRHSELNEMLNDAWAWTQRVSSAVPIAGAAA